MGEMLLMPVARIQIVEISIAFSCPMNCIRLSGIGATKSATIQDFFSRLR
jgi:hypothetical protein